MIYFMQPTDGGPVKIGHSINVDSRRQSLESHYGCPIAVLATMPGSRPEELALHARFAHLRFGKTEQFRPDPELMNFIGRPLLAGANPDSVEAIEPRTRLVGLRVSGEYADWLERLAKKNRTTLAGIIDRAIAEWAASEGHDEPAPERMP